MSETTTDAATQDEALFDPTVEAQPPVDEQPAEAVTTDSEPPTPTDEAETPAEPTEAVDNPDEYDFNAWLDKKGIDPTTPEGREAIAKSWRGLEQKMHESTSKASELATQVSQAPVDPDASEAQKALQIATNVQNAQIITNWKAQNNISAAEDVAMGNYAKANPNAAELLTAGLLTLDEFRVLANAAKPVDTEAIKAQGKKEALESIATKQGAASIASGASKQTPPPATDDIAAVWDD